MKLIKKLKLCYRILREQIVYTEPEVKSPLVLFDNQVGILPVVDHVHGKVSVTFYDSKDIHRLYQDCSKLIRIWLHEYKISGNDRDGLSNCNSGDGWGPNVLWLDNKWFVVSKEEGRVIWKNLQFVGFKTNCS